MSAVRSYQHRTRKLGRGEPLDAGDRVSLTLCLAVIAHLVVILGVGFKPVEDLREHTSIMHVMLVRKSTEEPPADADVQALAQANLNEQGGTMDEDILPTLPDVASPLPVAGEPMTAVPSDELPDMPTPENTVELDTLPAEVRDPVETDSVQPPPEPLLQAETEVAEAALVPVEPETDPESQAAAAVPPAPTPPSPVPPNLEAEQNAADLITSSYQIAALSAEIKRQLDERAKRPRRQFVSAATREYKYAAYMETWRQKVERVGNLNYPREARRKSLTGSLILDVALHPDGSLEAITVRRSSGNRILDDAAIYIVTLAAPFAPFPEDIRKEVDVLHITRTWQFLNSNSFQ